MRRETSTSSVWRLLALVGAVALVFGTVAGMPATAGAQQIDDPTDNRGPTDPEEGAQGADDKQTATVEKRLVFALSGYHVFPTRAELDDIGDADTITRLLRRFATSSDRRPSMRTRAIDALGYYDDAQTRDLLEALIERPSGSGATARVADLMRHHAITSLARAHGDGALETLGPLLDDNDLQIQLTTVVALGKHGGARARARLRTLRADSDERMIRREIDKYVGKASPKTPPDGVE